MHLSESSSHLHKYYPELRLLKDHNVLADHQSHDFFLNPQISIVRVAARILPSVLDDQCRKRLALRQSEGKIEEKCSSGLRSEREQANRKSSWDDMPKFLLAGAVSTFVSRTFIALLERVKLECIVHGSKYSWIDIVKWIWETEGAKGFWKGNVLNLFRMVPFKTINFICYDMYLDSLNSLAKSKEITNQDKLVGGGISAVTATVLCIPLDTVPIRSERDC